MEKLGQQQSNDIISTQQTQDLLKQMETTNPELSQFANKFQDNLKTKKFPDQNSELVAAISVLSEIKDKSQLQLAQQILTKTNIKPSLFASKTPKDNDTFLPYYTNLLQANNLVGKKLEGMKTPEGANRMEGKLKSLFNVWVGGNKKISTKGMEKTKKKAFLQNQISTFDNTAKSNFDAKNSLNELKINFLQKELDKIKAEKGENNPEYKAKFKEQQTLRICSKIISHSN